MQATKPGPGPGYWGALLGVTTVYFVAGKLGLMLAFVHANATAVWPPTGIALAGLLFLGYRIWPAIFLGAFLVNISTPLAADVTAGHTVGGLPGVVLKNISAAVPFATSFGIAVGNTLEGLLGAWLVNRFAAGRNAFDHPRTVFKFAVLAGMVGTTVSATIGVTSLSAGGLAAWADYGTIWLTWWLGDAGGALIVAPLFILWRANARVHWAEAGTLETVLVLMVLVLVGQFEFGGWLTADIRNSPLTFLSIPPVLWAAFRLGQRETVTMTCLLSAMAIYGTMHGYGPFVGGTQNESLVFLQAFMGVIAVMAMAVAAVVSEQRRAEGALRKAHGEMERRVNERTAELGDLNRKLQASRAQLAEAQQIAQVGSWEWDITRNLFVWSDELYRIFGLKPQEMALSFEKFLEYIHPGDRVSVRRTVERSCRDLQPFGLEHRIVRPDGTERIVQGRGEVIFSPAGQALRMIGTCQDITVRKLADAVLSDAHNELEKRVQERTAELAAANEAFLSEIIDHKRTTEALRESQTKLQAIFENSIDAISLSKAGIHSMVNPAYLNLFGYSLPEELVGKSVLEVIAPSQRETIRDLLRRRTRGEPAPAHYETCGLRRNGTELDLEVDVSAYKLQGEMYTLVMTRDVTERKRAEQLLRESEGLKSAILESALDCIIAMNHEGRIIEWNPAAEKTFGYGRDEVLGASMGDLIVPPLMRGKHRQGLARYLTTGESRVLGRRIQMTALRADGSEFPVELSITRIQREGPPAFTAYVRDITERQQAEEARNQLAAIVESSDDAIIGMALDGTIVSWNAGAARIFGYPAAETVGRLVTRLIVPPENENEEPNILEKLKRGERMEHYETVRLHKDGRRIDVSLTISPVKDANGRIIGVSKIARDITERKRIEAEIRKLNEQLEQRVAERTAQLETINKELESFTYSVSHDLRAPLRALQGLSNALTEDYGDRLEKTGKDYCQRIGTAAGRMDTLIQDLLSYSRLSRTDLEMRAIDLAAIVADVKHHLESDLRDGKVELSVPEGLPIVLGHRATLGQVVGNLVSNAIKFIPKGVAPQVRIRAEDQGEFVRLWVEDNGIGIAPEHQQRIFRIFERLHGVETYPGTGIGLAIVQKGVERLAGRVGVESAEGSGSKFWIELKKAQLAAC